MKKQLLTFFIILSSLTLFSQVKFEKGFFIDQANNKVECLIKNYDWVSPPNEIEYKISDESLVETRNFTNMNSFQVYNTSHYYKKAKINIDRELKKRGSNPKTETTILKVIVEGEASLYTTSGMFFYQIKDQDIKQLLYKKYVDENSRIKDDVSFRTELYNNLKCEDNVLVIRKINYKEKELIKFFKNYNLCKNSEAKDYSEYETKTKLQLNINAGLALSKGTYIANEYIPGSPSGGGNGSLNKYSSEAKSYESNVLFGLEAEVLLPFNKNKWSAFVAPNYQQVEYQMSEDINPSGSPILLLVDCSYSYLDIPFGVRRYFFLNENSKLFLDVSYSFIFPMEIQEIKRLKSNGGITDPLTNVKKPEGISSSLRFGLGYKYNKKYALCLNYYPVKKVSNTEVNGFSIIASYTIF